MTEISALIDGFGAALSPVNLLWALLGVTIGTAVGVLPGIGPALTVALLLPLTFRLDPAASLIMFAGIYYGGMYGGSTTSILLNTPGESASMVSALEGNKMARAGRGAAALAAAAIGSFVAGTIGTVGLTFLAPVVADFAVGFGPPEYVALMALAFVTVSALLGRSILRGAASLLIGVTIGLVGIDQQSGDARLAFGLPSLLDGIDVVVVVVALFALGETFSRLMHGTGGETVEPVRDRAVLSRSDWRRSWPAWLRGSALGFPIGSLPAGGAEVPTFLSYSVEKRLSKRREEFGHGAIEGVAGPEAANNAAAAGVLVPLLTIGLPTSATAAVILTAFQSYGLQPGPQLFSESGPLLWTLIASLYIGNVMLLVLNLPLVRMWARLLTIPAYAIYAAVLVFATLGTFASGGTTADLLILYALGLLALLMHAADVPIAPAVVGLILGPLLEQELRRALALSQGDPMILVSSPLTVVLWVLMALALALPLVAKAVRRDVGRAAEADPERPEQEEAGPPPATRA
ncbi:tripartite tricarboxylate transporter permease [Streptomonospora nanhaiensis]|uniref:tripartite tricarboxylate transporter permease n=1 Tax=Streptomonospora nanhaiensis TaxID=1323731 RepID=UPI001C38DB07|nr:tripartite tricarboxylate transporter permease [Streptomonospora nanhaiensis]MBV2362968.1 tripartite tricarboxylate transporter permease [Streptomonospora nanhaiensis]MBX9390166.1 tripartite tricarboxylate transporter permease [Streptomonospora nanhaiensis]